VIKTHIIHQSQSSLKKRLAHEERTVVHIWIDILSQLDLKLQHKHLDKDRNPYRVSKMQTEWFNVKVSI